MDEIPEQVWSACPLRGRNLTADTLAGEIGSAPALLVFLRHLG